MNEPLIAHPLALELPVTQAAANLLWREVQALGRFGDGHVSARIDHVFSIAACAYSVTA